MTLEENHPLDQLFKPKNMAVVGATPKKTKSWNSGNSWIAGAINHDFSGKIYPVHPRAETILGYKAYASIKDIPDELDFAVFTIPAKAALQVMAECVEKKVKFVHLLTSGFSETGREEDAELEKEILAVAQKGGVRLVGPNCMGVYCPESGLSWQSEFPHKPGRVGIFSQSGQLASHLVMEGYQENLRFSKVVSFGNGADLQAHDFLEYLGQDPQTEIIGSYLEGVKNGRAFFEAAREVAGRKPLVIWKGGQTKGGSRATQSHTAAIAGAPAIWEAMCQQTGIISVHSMPEAIFTMSALKNMMLPAGVRVAILGGAGGGSVTMTDLAEKEKLTVPKLSDHTVNELNKFVPLAGNSVKNPLDVFFNTDDEFMRLMELLRDDQEIDAMIYDLRIRWMYRELGSKGMNHMISRIVDGQKTLGKPLMLVMQPEGIAELDAVKKNMENMFHAEKVATFPNFETAARILNNLNQYRQFLESCGYPIWQFGQQASQLKN